jgi:alpha-beta hydrolase superfamily lysophospholipase
MIRKLGLLTLGITLSLACAGCNWGSSDKNNGGTSPATGSGNQRGTLTTSPPAKLSTYSPSDLLSQLSGNDLGKLLLQAAFTPTCSVTVYQLQYNTVGGQNEATTASGALMVPSGSDAKCQGPRPILVYAHGTSTDKAYNIADLSKQSNGEGLLLAAIFAGEGYVVVAPNYAGYDTSSLGYHPYLNADQQSKDTVDALTAARSAFSGLGLADNQKLFVTGYSQGGFVAMATHRALQAAGTAVTASAPMSGPYALAAFADAIFEGEVTLSANINFTMLATSYQHSYGNVYSNPGDVFEAKYAAGIDAILPSTMDVSALYAQGKLPQNALFNSTPPAPQYAAMTPATTPPNLAPAFAKGFGSDNLVTNAYRLNYLQDAQANPDGGFPNTTTDTPTTTAKNGLRQDAAKNDLRNWSPTAPVLLCAGDSDPTVLYLNTQLMQGYWAKAAPTASVTVLDVDSASSSGDPYGSLKTGFAAAKAAVAASGVAGGATDGGALSVLQAYHATLVPPFCLQAVKSFFDTH